MTYKLRGWKLSYYTGKMMCYMNYKQIPHELRLMNAYDLIYLTPKYTGAVVMPVVETPQGKWLQDTRDIIEYLETQYPENSVFPSNPSLRFLSNLFEAWGDEFWVPFAMYYRWNFPASKEFFMNEATTNLLPGFVPQFIKKPIAKEIAKRLMGFLPAVGVRPDQYIALEAWTHEILRLLNQHFAQSAYLLGNRPYLGDFGLAGPLVAHLNRDTYPRNHVMTQYPHVQAYCERMVSGVGSKSGPGSSCPTPDLSSTSLETLTPIIQTIFREFIPMIDQTNQHVRKLLTNPKFAPLTSNNNKVKCLPRRLDDISITLTIADQAYPFIRSAIPFNCWKFAKVLNDDYSHSSSSESPDHHHQQQQIIIKDLQEKLHIPTTQIQQVFQLQIPKMQRQDVRVRFA
jgi:glutathione S-transferase